MPLNCEIPVSAQNRRVIRRILEFVRRHKRFLVSGHVRSDGDALGSQLAVGRWLRKMGKTAHVVCDQGVADNLRFLPGADEVGSGPEDLRPPYDALFTLDSGAYDRLERVGEALPKGLPVVNIDHHISNERFGAINWIDPEYAATGELVYDLIRASRVEMDAAMATNLYVAILTDTGRFGFSNTDSRVHLVAADLLAHGVRPSEVTKQVYREKHPGELKLMAEVIRRMRFTPDGRVGWVAVTRRMVRECGYELLDTQPLIELIQAVRGVRLAVLLRELAERGKVKVSLRSDRGVDSQELAKRWGGGGHKRAAGATFEGTVRQAQREVLGAARRCLRECGRDGS